MDLSKTYERYSSGRVATIEDVNKWISRLRDRSKKVQFEKINPIAYGCDGYTLRRLGRQSEIDYGR